MTTHPGETLDAKTQREIVQDSGTRDALLLPTRVDRYSQVSVRTNRYSVPARLIGCKVREMLHTPWS